MSNRTVPREHARDIAEACGDLAEKALSWKARALAAEEALRKFAGEIYARDRDASLAEDAKRLSPEGVAVRAGTASPEPSIAQPHPGDTV